MILQGYWSLWVPRLLPPCLQQGQWQVLRPCAFRWSLQYLDVDGIRIGAVEVEPQRGTETPISLN